MELTETVKERMNSQLMKAGVHPDQFDLEHEYDRTLSEAENLTIIKQKLLDYGLVKEDDQIGDDKKEIKQIELECLDYQKEQFEHPKFPIDLDKTDSIAVTGIRNSGKTNLAFYLMEAYKGKKQKYLYGYPIQIKGYTQLSTWSDLLRVKDGVIFVDEIQRYIKLYDRKANVELMELLSFLAHQNNTIIFTTSLTQFITKGVEASIQTWLIKQIDVGSLKNGCKAKRILQQTANPRITDKGMALEVDEFIAYDDLMPVGFNGVHHFPNMKIGKDWKIKSPEIKTTEKISEPKNEQNTDKNSEVKNEMQKMQ